MPGGPVHAIHLRRAHYLRLLGDAPGARREQELADGTPPSTALDWFLVGQERLLRRNVRAAVAAFDNALAERPDLY